MNGLPETNPLLKPLWDSKRRYQWDPKRERAIHREMVAMSLQGYEGPEIAVMLGRHKNTVNRILASPRAQGIAVEAIAHNAQSDLRAMLESAGPAALTRVIEMASDADLKFKEPKLFADLNQSIVDRLLGKATQPITTAAADPAKMTDEEQDRRLAELRAQAAAPCAGLVPKAEPENPYEA